MFKSKNKKVTIGLIFGSFAFSLLFFTLFAIVSGALFSPFVLDTMSYVKLLALIVLSVYCFIIQTIKLGYYIEEYLINHKVLPNETEINKKDNII